MIQVRPMQLEDCQAVRKIDEACFVPADRWELATFEKMFSYSTYHYCVAEQINAEDGNKILCGAAGINIGGDIADVMTVAVVEEYRKQGIGQQLLQWLIEQAEVHGCRTMLLEVREGNAAARNLYQTQGFTEIAIRKDYYAAPKEAAVIMQRILKANDRN